MLCDVCKQNEATVYLTQIVEGQMQKVNLCESCSKKKGVTDPTGFALADLLLGLGSTENVGSPVEQDEACAACGFTQADFKKTGRLGCPECYRIFGDGLDSLLKAMHKGTRHIGKIPSRQAKHLAMADRIGSLRDRLDNAVAKENYEEAAQ